MQSAAGSSVERLLVVRLSAMGDVIHTLPAAQALRDAFPRAMIGWLVEERWAELLCAPQTPRRGPRSPQRPLVDWVHSVELSAWRRSLFRLQTLQQIAKVWGDVRSVRYDVAIDLQGAIRSAVLARWSGTRVVYGSGQPREAPASLWYTRQTPVRGVHVIEQNLSIAEGVVGHPVTLRAVELPRDAASENRICESLKRAGIGDYIILNPGAGWGAKRWPAARYGDVARELAADGFNSVINYGPGEERLAEEVVAASAGTAKAMKLSLSELIALSRHAGLFIGGDTGPMHMAAALQVPVVAIFGPTNPARNGPYGTRSVVLRNPASTTSHARHSQPDEAMLDISARDVVSAARTLLSRSGAGDPHD